MNSGYLVCSSRNVLLPGHDAPQPATITIDSTSGKITDIKHEYIRNANSTSWLDAGDQYILPGLVE